MHGIKDGDCHACKKSRCNFFGYEFRCVFQLLHGCVRRHGKPLSRCEELREQGSSIADRPCCLLSVRFCFEVDVSAVRCPGSMSSDAAGTLRGRHGVPRQVSGALGAGLIGRASAFPTNTASRPMPAPCTCARHSLSLSRSPSLVLALTLAYSLSLTHAPSPLSLSPSL